MADHGTSISFDDALSRYVGEFGRSQIRTLLLASLIWIGNSIVILLMVFHSSPSPIKEKWWSCTDPSDARCAEVLAMADPGQDFCELPQESWAWTQPSKSIISQFNLICGSAWKSQLANSGFFVGYLIGSGVFGGASDKYGRKPVLFGCTAWGALFTALAGVSPNYGLYFAFRLLTGIGAAGQALTAYILSTESVGPSWRGTAGVATQLFFVVGEFVLVLVAYLARPWRALCFACALINVAMMALWFTVTESPRWLLVTGKVDKATAIMRKIAETNGRAMPPMPLASGAAGAAPSESSKFRAAAAAAATAAAEEGHAEANVRVSGNGTAGGGGGGAGVGGAAPGSTPSSTFGVEGLEKREASGLPAAAGQQQQQQGNISLTSMLMRDKHMLRRFLILAYVWLVMCMSYYGISMAVGGLPGSVYVTFMIAAAAEFPANILAAWMIEKYGRHNTLAAGMLVGGAGCLCCSFVPPGAASAAFAAVGKFGCAGAFTVASIFTSELFPTLVRSAVLGAENQAARVGGIAAPFIVLLGASRGSGALPFIIFGVASLVAGALIFTLPETLGTKLPDTMADMGGIASIFTTRPWRKGGWRMTLREMFRSRAAAHRPSSRSTSGFNNAPSNHGTAAHGPPAKSAAGVGASPGEFEVVDLQADGRGKEQLQEERSSLLRGTPAKSGAL